MWEGMGKKTVALRQVGVGGYELRGGGVGVEVQGKGGGAAGEIFEMGAGSGLEYPGVYDKGRVAKGNVERRGRDQGMGV